MLAACNRLLSDKVFIACQHGIMQSSLIINERPCYVCIESEQPHVRKGFLLPQITVHHLLNGILFYTIYSYPHGQFTHKRTE